MSKQFFYNFLKISEGTKKCSFDESFNKRWGRNGLSANNWTRLQVLPSLIQRIGPRLGPLDGPAKLHSSNEAGQNKAAVIVIPA